MTTHECGTGRSKFLTIVFHSMQHMYAKRTKVFVRVQTVPHGRNMHAT